MESKPQFPVQVIRRIQTDRILGIRAGTNSTHRVIGIWAVVVEGRVFVRSWSMSPRGWWQTLVEDPWGSVFVGEQEIPIRAVQTRSERLKDLVSAAYKQKYNTPGSVQYVKDLTRKKLRATTTELVAI